MNLKRFSYVIIIMLIIIGIFATSSNAYESTNETSAEPDYISITHTNLSTNESEDINISTKDTGNTLETYVPKIENTQDNTSRASRAIIGFNDERRLITDTTQYPYSAIAYILITWPDNSEFHGTAFMISPNKALTAAHCVYDASKGGLPKKIQVIPGKNGAYFWNNPYGSVTVNDATDIFYPTAYESNGVSGNDWAILKLDENIGNECGWLNLQVGGYSYGTEGETFHTSGYPVHKLDSEDKRYIGRMTDYLLQYRIEYQFHSSGIISNVYFNHFEHKLDTLPGQSGSPIYKYDENNNVKVIGIHNQSQPRSEEPLEYNGKYLYDYNMAAKINFTIVNTATAF